MKIMIAIFIFLSLISGIALLLLAYERIHTAGLTVMLVVGIISVLAAVFYTIGKRPYGYLGLGDMFVFIFFGLVSVQGSFFLYTGSYEINTIIPAVSVGLLSAGVLNINNMRDHINDKDSGKHTLVVRIGIKKAKIYHYFLIGTALLSSFLFLAFTQNILIGLVFIIPAIPLIFNIIKVHNIQDPREFDPELKKLALATLVFTVGLGTLNLLPLC
jgi:1,4-dihydroxy-2-naphthoate octaprenyltransferase